MIIIDSPKALQAHLSIQKKAGKRLGFVPTMGALHEGHLTLVRRAKKENDLVIVSIFVNPTQFGPKEDFKKYPRTLEADLKQLEQCKTDIVFTPSAEAIYSSAEVMTLDIPNLTKKLCGKSRPNHFKGVLIVVNKLLQIIQPDRAYFGEKDFQQLALITHMAKNLFMPTEIIGCACVREPDGLALSSRNRYLTTSERKIAPILYQSLQKIKSAFTHGETDCKTLKKIALATLKTQAQIKLDYIEIIDPLTLASKKRAAEGDRVLIAAYLAKTRLIDNIALR